MPKPDYGALVDALERSVGDALRWVASFDSETYGYRVHHVREDLETELTDRDLQTIVHRSIAVFNRQHVEDVYFHLGPAESLVVEHERATAVHLYLDDRRGVVVKLEGGAEVKTPGFREDALDALYDRD